MRSQLKQARQRVEALRLALLRPMPEEIGAVLPGLEEAARCLQIVEQKVREGASTSYAIRSELKLLKNDLRISARLIEQGTIFWQGWAKMLEAGAAYTQAGHRVPPERSAGVGRTISLRG